MPSLCFTKAPPLPVGIDREIWDAEWIGLRVGIASAFPMTVGYLGEEPARVYDSQTMVWREGTPNDGMNVITNMLTDPMWVSHHSLLYTCKYSLPERPTILAWLSMEPQQHRRVYAVPDNMAEYLP